jgi:hypothetical protein
MQRQVAETQREMVRCPFRLVHPKSHAKI